MPQLVELLTDAGFGIVQVKGVAPMPRSARSHVFQPGELRPDAPLSDRPETGYLLYAEAAKILAPGSG
jgi:hypothetical protein